VSTPAPARQARARLGRWPFDDDTVHLVLLDHHMVPTADDVHEWLYRSRTPGATRVRTGALFPDSTAPFLEAGFEVIDTLTLLAADLAASTPPAVPTSAVRPAGSVQPGHPVRLRRLRPTMLLEAAEIDRRSFSTPWANDRAALDDITAATPHHRSRSVHVARRMAAFSISGRADHVGYVQRLAVDPSARRRGFARLLLDDAMHWMRRRDVTRVLVNTASDNHAALRLYRSAGFVEQPGELVILERALR
jgi:ribosomal protein S18 acetylase RimI-like enzyme